MLSSRERNIGLITVLILGALVADRLLLAPLLARRAEASDRVEAAERDLRTAEQTFQNDLRARRRWREMAGETLLAQAPEAEGQLLNAVRDWAQSAGLSLTSLKPERGQEESGFARVTVRATATGSMRSTSQFLIAAQSAAIPVRVSDLTITSRREGTDDLMVNVALATIYLPPEDLASAAAAGKAPR